MKNYESYQYIIPNDIHSQLIFVVTSRNSVEIRSWSDLVRNFPSGIVEIHASTLNSTTELNFQRVSGEFWRDDLVVIADGIREDDSCADQCIVNATCQGFLIGQQGKLISPGNTAQPHNSDIFVTSTKVSLFEYVSLFLYILTIW